MEEGPSPHKEDQGFTKSTTRPPWLMMDYDDPERIRSTEP